MRKKYISLLFSLLCLSKACISQTIETVNEIVISGIPSKCYIVNKEGRIVGGSTGLVIRAANSFFMRANETFYNSPSPGKNFVRTEVYNPGAFDINMAPVIPVKPKYKIYEYFDGLGTLTQTIKVGQSPSLSDHITFNAVDEFGRTTVSYLPYTKKTGGMFRDSLIDEQAAFYKGTHAVASDSKPYAYNVFDDSPQNNIRKSFSVGWKWHNTTPSVSNLRVNTSTEVKKLVLNSYGVPVYSGDQYFAKGVFTVSESADESGFVTRTYRDLDNRVVHEKKGSASGWHETFYLYDISGNLRFIFPPEASSRLLKFASTTDKQEFLDLWCFQFKYDKLGRLTEKKVPGADWIYHVYDNWNRLALSQDGNQRMNNQWTFNKYDVHNRVIMTGQISGVKATLESNILQSTVRFEDRARNSIGYTNKAFPAHDENSLLTISYYDCYQFLTYPSWDSEAINFYPVPVTSMVETNQLLFQVNATATTLPAVRGQLTGTRVKVPGTNRWLNAVTYYNRQYQPVQTISENFVGGKDVVSRLFDKFSGVIYRSNRVHSSTSRTITVDEQFIYDKNDRLLKAYHTIDGKQRVLLASNRYNELGQLVEKNVHSTDDVNFLQSIDYRYNVQGWLTHINNSSLTSDNNVNDDTNDLFGMEIIYNDPVNINNGVFKPLAFYDGNVAAVKWKTNSKAPGIVTKEKIYGFQYDHFKRFSKGYYASGSGTTWNGDPGLFNEVVSSYDGNGNIDATTATGLTRNGSANGAAAVIDDLDYQYNGNQLKNVLDKSLHISGFTDKPGADASVLEYLYDKNGNTVHDLNKSVSSIRYNHLNLPTEIEFTRELPVRTDRIVYTYDALGNKLRKDVFVGGVPVWRTDYAQGLQYDNGRLSFLRTSEGRAVFDNADASYEYFLRDYQNNVRVVCGLLKETDIYLATMETPLDSQEKVTYGFSNITATRSVGNNITRPSEKVTSPDKSARCNGFSNATVVAVPIGPAKVVKVNAGDVVYGEVYSRFNNAKTSSTAILPAALGSFVSTAFNLGAIESQIVRTRLSEQAQLVASGSTYAEIVPKGYLAFIFLDMNHNPVFSAAVSISEKSFRAFEKLSRSFKFDREGHLFIYVANESNSASNIDVFFDDLYIVHEKNSVQPQVIQSSDYYPFGLSFNSYSKDRLRVASTTPVTTYEPMLRNRYLFQGQELEADLGLGWYQFKFRMHDPAIGRFNSIDPLSEKYAHLSPYAFSGNQLTNAIELEGAEPKTFFETVKWASPIAFKFDFSLSSHDAGIGFNISLGLPKSFPMSVRYEWGATYKAEDILTGKPATETRSAIETAYLNGLVSFKTTNYVSGETSQKTGMVTVGFPFANVQYENDWHPSDDILSWADPFDFHPDTQTDMFRTAALSVNFGLYTSGFNLGTGNPGPIGSRNVNKYLGGKAGLYELAESNGHIYDPNNIRLGIGYLGVGPFRLGLDSESIRHRIQNVWTHDRISDPSPWFKVMPTQNQIYFGYTFGTTTQW